MAGYLTDIKGIKVGHWTSKKRPTGCTVIIVEEGAIAGVDVRGSAPGTRETDLLKPTATVPAIHAITLAGGSAFGLDAATGVMRYLEQHHIGFDTKVARVPIVPAAIIFDLQLGDSSIRPDDAAGYIAASSAKTGEFEVGSVGAGAGATVGKLFGAQRAMRGGLGTASIQLNTLIVSALVVVNALGDIFDPVTGQIVAGARNNEGNLLLNSMAALRDGRRPTIFAPTNTTLGVVATNATLTKAQATKMAEMAQDGLARAINPIHTPYDGDAVFALSTGEISHPYDLLTIGALAADVLAEAVVNAIQSAESYGDIPSAGALSREIL